MLLCAGILGRYYTDYHEVDEDMTAIVRCGGGHYAANAAGIARRNLYDAPSYTLGFVASRLIYLS